MKALANWKTSNAYLCHETSNCLWKKILLQFSSLLIGLGLLSGDYSLFLFTDYRGSQVS